MTRTRFLVALVLAVVTVSITLWAWMAPSSGSVTPRSVSPTTSSSSTTTEPSTTTTTVAPEETTTTLAPQPRTFVPSAPPVVVPAPPSDPYGALRDCESSGNYANTNNPTYRGAYQFDQSTWDGVVARLGLPYVGVDPATAPPSVQDAAAVQLHAERGWQPWPACSARLGLQ